MSTTDYRSSHTTTGAGHRYNQLFADEQYDGWIWSREQRILTAIVDGQLGRGRFRFLDFACGTGRILRFLEPFASEAVGVDVSSEMLGFAQRSVPRAQLYNTDLTRGGSLLDGEFDLATAFRFFLNAEGSLRVEALAALREVLKEDGFLVVNIHGNMWSMKLPSFLFRRLILRQNLNVMSRRSMTHLLERCGFRIVRVFGVGWCSPQIFRFLGRKWADRIEDWMEQIPALTRFSTDLIYLCVRAG